MSDNTARRFACRACGHVHFVWSARCMNPKCHKLEGLIDAEILAAETRAAAKVPATVAAEPMLAAVTPISSHPRLMIVRDPVTDTEDEPEPELDLEDPSEELIDDVGAISIPSDDLVPLSEISETTFARNETGLTPLDAVLGGGLVVGSLVVLGGEAGLGKSTLTMQAMTGLKLRTLYATGEETLGQVAARARRIGMASDNVFPLNETDLDIVLGHARKIRAQFLVIDSAQTLASSDFTGHPGSTAQVKGCVNRLMKFAKSTETAVWLIGHATNDNTLAGPATLKHLVDVVLELEKGPRPDGSERLLRCRTKNRFGATNVVGRFEITGDGLFPLAPADGDGWDESF